MLMHEAKAKLAVPAKVANVNTVQDGVWRLRDALKLADRFYTPNDQAPSYVVEAVNGLQNWVDYEH